MNLTEPQAGSDLGALRTRAVPAQTTRWGEHYRITGQKIFITYGEHDLADNIVHMVLARTPDAPPGSRGISLFLVPKFLPDADGTPGERNDLRPLRVEDKLGIHASPTCVMSYGEEEGAVGWRIGEENRGLECMFTMMNSERLLVGVQGVAIAERAYQQARDYARTRVQGRPAGAAREMPEAPPIVHHPDVRRMLLSMRAGDRGDARAELSRRRCDRREPPRRRRQGAVPRAAPGRPADPGRQGVVHRSRRRDRLDRHPGAWRDGLHRGDRRGAILSRRADRADLRGHQRHPGERPGRPQARPRRRRGGARAVRRDAADPDRDRRRGGVGGDASRPRRGLDALERATAYLVEAEPAHRRGRIVALSGAVRHGRRRLADGAPRAGRRASDGDSGFAAAKRATARIYAEHFLPRAPAYLPAIEGGATVVEFDPELL